MRPPLIEPLDFSPATLSPATLSDIQKPLCEDMRQDIGGLYAMVSTTLDGFDVPVPEHE